MLLFRILNFISGYVIITVPRSCLEKFINLAYSRSILLWDAADLDAHTAVLKVRLHYVQPLRHVARMTGCRFKIIRRAGLPFVLSRLGKRKVLWAGAVVAVLALYVLFSFVWLVEVTGNKNVEKAVLVQAAKEAGLYRGAFKYTINPLQVEEQLIKQVPDLSWVGISISGTRAQIEVVEKILPRQEHGGQPVDVVAKKDGLIKEILVLSGHPLVADGDTVTAGQVLISAAIPPPEPDEPDDADAPKDLEQQHPPEPWRYVRARGYVRARVWYEGYGEMPLQEHVSHLTGQQTTQMGIKIGAKEIILMGPKEPPYTHYDALAEGKKLPHWRNLNLPVELIAVKYCEKKQSTNSYNKDEARDLAGDKAWSAALAKMPPGVKILNKRWQVVNTTQPEKLVRVKVLVEVLEDIGTIKPHQTSGVNPSNQGGY